MRASEALDWGELAKAEPGRLDGSSRLRGTSACFGAALEHLDGNAVRRNGILRAAKVYLERNRERRLFTSTQYYDRGIEKLTVKVAKGQGYLQEHRVKRSSPGMTGFGRTVRFECHLHGELTLHNPTTTLDTRFTHEIPMYQGSIQSRFPMRR